MQEGPRSRASNTRAQTPALLKGLLFGPDGAAFSPSHTRKKNRLYRYYVSQTVLKHGAGTCPVGRVPAAEIEAAVVDQLRAVFRQPEIIIGTWKAAKPHDGEITEAKVREALMQFDPLWDELFPAEQARIVQLLQLARKLDWRLRADHFSLGLFLFSVGLFKKSVSIDPFVPHIDVIFDHAATGDAISMLDGWTAAIGYSFQIYFDFSGYSDMAIGLAFMFGIRLPINFFSPYKAASIREF